MSRRNTRQSNVPNTSPHLNIPGRAIPRLIDEATETISLLSTERLLLIKIINASGTKGVMWHRNETLAEKLGTTKRTIQYGLATLQSEGKIVSVFTNQDQPKGRRYLCPWPTRIEDILVQLHRAGVKCTSWTGEVSFTPSDPKNAQILSELHIDTHKKNAPNTQKNICTKESKSPNVIPLHKQR